MGILSKFVTPLFAVLCLSGLAYADAMCNHADVEKLGFYLHRGLEAEKAGRTLEALLFFRAADEFCGNRAEARKGLSRIGMKMGAAVQKKGSFFSGKSILAGVPDEDCRRWARHVLISPNPYEPEIPGLCTVSSGGMRLEVNPSAGAYEWYESTYNYRESDSLVIRVLSSDPSDLEAAERAFMHFRSRERLIFPGYSIDPAHLALLRGTISSNLDSILVKEEKSFGDTRSAAGSLKLLGSAMKWADMAGKSGAARVYARAVRRAEEALNGTSTKDLHDAMEFYSFAGVSDALKRVRERADELGVAAMAEKEPERALGFFNISGNRKLIKKAESLAEKIRRSKARERKNSGPARPL